MNKEQIRDCLRRDIAYARKIKNKIDELANTHAYKQFIDLLDIEKILLTAKIYISQKISYQKQMLRWSQKVSM